jgi:hypothetical protein
MGLVFNGNANPDKCSDRPCRQIESPASVGEFIDTTKFRRPGE